MYFRGAHHFNVCTKSLALQVRSIIQQNLSQYVNAVKWCRIVYFTNDFNTE